MGDITLGEIIQYCYENNIAIEIPSKEEWEKSGINQNQWYGDPKAQAYFEYYLMNSPAIEAWRKKENILPSEERKMMN